MTLVMLFLQRSSQNQLDSEIVTTQKTTRLGVALNVGGKIKLENHLMFILANFQVWWIFDLGFYRFITMIGLPSGKHTKNYGKIHHFSSWVNPLFRMGHGFQFANCFSTHRLGKPPFSYGFPMVFPWFSQGFPSYKPPFSSLALDREETT